MNSTECYCFKIYPSGTRPAYRTAYLMKKFFGEKFGLAAFYLHLKVYTQIISRTDLPVRKVNDTIFPVPKTKNPKKISERLSCQTPKQFN